MVPWGMSPRNHLLLNDRSNILKREFDNGRLSQARMTNRRHVLFYLLYALFVFIWFKDNLPPLKQAGINRIIPVVGLISLLVIQLLLTRKAKGWKPKFRLNDTHLLIVGVILLAFVMRIPYLMNNNGLFNSDDAIPALMSKHISEGKLPPVYFYGQLYMGSFAEHLYAVLIVIFGYSPLLLKVAPLMFYSAFLVIQFIFLRQLFSESFSLAVSLFYCLPIGRLLFVSMDNSHKDALVLLFGAALLYAAFQIHYQKREGLIPVYGLLLGLGFWTHQITISFIVASFLYIVLALKLRLKKYLLLASYGLLGLVPVLMMEVYWKFPLLKYLTGGETGLINWTKFENTYRLFLRLITRNSHPAAVMFPILALIGLLALLIPSIKKRTLLPQTMFGLLFLTFLIIYWISGFSRPDALRYLYPLYVCLPVLLLSPLDRLKSKLKYPLMGIVVVSLFLFFNLKGASQDLGVVRSLHNSRKRVVTLMRESGRKLWRSEFWSAYLMDALGREEFIVDSYSLNRYHPYSLAYGNFSENENFLFMIGALGKERNIPQRFNSMLERLGIPHRRKQIDDAWLIYDIQSPVFTENLLARVPRQIPEIEIIRLNYAKGYLNITFKNKGSKKNVGGFRVHFEIPGYSSTVRDFPLRKDRVRARIPFPRKDAFNLRYRLDYQGLRIPASAGEITCTPPLSMLKQKRPRMMYLSGFGPVVELAEMQGLRICEKEVSVEINRPLDKDKRLRLSLHSPFEFSDPKWYGNFFQGLDVYINQQFHSSHRLKDGGNSIELALEGMEKFPAAHRLDLKFKYHHTFRFMPFWKTAALLEKIEVF